MKPKYISFHFRNQKSTKTVTEEISTQSLTGDANGTSNGVGYKPCSKYWYFSNFACLQIFGVQLETLHGVVGYYWITGDLENKYNK